VKSLVRITAPEVEPVSVEEAMAYLRVTDGDESVAIETSISVAREMVENFTGRAMLTQTWQYISQDWPRYSAARISLSDANSVAIESSSWRSYSNDSRSIFLDRTPLASVESVKYYPADGTAQTTLATSAYHVLTAPQPGLVYLKSAESWPAIADRPDAIEVNFTAGYATPDLVPAVQRQAVLLALSHVYENRGAINIGNIVNELPFSLKYMLESQRVGGWVA
jgi:uncharacterized phiE125 gp8 family phage protein